MGKKLHLVSNLAFDDNPLFSTLIVLRLVFRRAALGYWTQCPANKEDGAVGT